ncbi:MAG: hypothetical protein ABI408_09090 [Gemmatimonadaceae bacterium]
MMRRFLFAFLLTALGTAPLSAQRRSNVYKPSGDPGAWFTVGVGGFTGTGVNDGRSASTWDFGNSTNLEYRASLEEAMASGSSFGVSGSWAHVPFVYSSTTGLSSEDAHLDMMTLLATFHSGGGVGFHQVIELNGGVVAYRNLKSDFDGATLAPSGGNIDPLFSIGYGVGYGFGPRTQIDFVPDYAIAIHERTGLSNGSSNTNSMRSLRLTLRMGF